jgi:1,4-alpha-glucan branching enzyme
MPTTGSKIRPTENDLHLWNEGTHRRAYEMLGAHVHPDGTRFAVWAPNARAVSVMGDFSDWSPETLEPIGSSGIWGGTLQNARKGHAYKYVIESRDGHLLVPDYVAGLGFTHVELLAADGAPVLRFVGISDDGLFRANQPIWHTSGLHALVDRFHQAGIGVILDWVPSHFPTDEHGLGMFDGTHLFEHADRRQGFPAGLEDRMSTTTAAKRFRPFSSATLCSGSIAITSTGSGSTRWLRCSISTIPGGRRVDTERPRRQGEPRGDRLPPETQ